MSFFAPCRSYSLVRTGSIGGSGPNSPCAAALMLKFLYIQWSRYHVQGLNSSFSSSILAAMPPRSVSSTFAYFLSPATLRVMCGSFLRSKSSSEPSRR